MMCALRRFIWPISSSAAANSWGNVDAFIWNGRRQGQGAETRIKRIENREGTVREAKKNLLEKVKCLLALYRIIRLPLVKVAFTVGLLNLCRMQKNRVFRWSH